MRSVVLAGVVAVTLLGGTSSAEINCNKPPRCPNAAVVSAARAIVDRECPCAEQTSKKKYKKCAKNAYKAARQELGVTLTKDCEKDAKAAVNNATCGRAGTVACNKRNGNDTKTTCKIVKTSKCRGSACGAFTSCADACNDEAQACATTTTTSTSTSSTTSTTVLPCVCGDGIVNNFAGCPEGCEDGNTTDGDDCDSNCTLTRCGNGIVTAPEACDPNSPMNTCGAGQVCDATCACVAQAACTCGTGEPTQLRFTTKVPTPNTSCGSLLAADGDPFSIGGVPGLACGGLFFGGGGCSVPLPAGVPDEGTSISNVTCNGDTLHISAATAAEAGGTEPLESCTSAGCLFGPPLPIPNANSAPTSTCIINVVAADAVGTATCSTGEVPELNMPLSSLVYLTGDLDVEPANGIQPCPICQDNGTCRFGPNDGMPCTPDSTGALGAAFPTSHDCPPPPIGFLGALPIDFRLTTGTATRTAYGLGIEPGRSRIYFGFCRDNDVTNNFGVCTGGTTPGVGCAESADCGEGGTCGGTVRCNTDADCVQPLEACSQRNDGAFGKAAAQTISLTGSPAGDLGPRTVLPSTLVSIFAIQPVFAPTIDAVADLPGPGAVALEGETQLLP